MTAVRDWGAFSIHVGDCRQVLAAMPAGSFDSCVTDPPYGDTSLEWDKQCAGWVPAVSRVLKPTASVWVFGSLRFLVQVFGELEKEGFRYSQDLVWEKQNGTGFHADRFRRVHEHAVLFYRGKWSEVYHSPQFTMDARAKVVRAKRRPSHTGHIDKTPYVSVDGGPRLRRSVMQVRNEHGRAVHPTQKPIELMNPIVRYSCAPGSRTLDPFAGSGSTGVAAVAAGVHFTGIDLSSANIDIAERRIAAALFGPTAFGVAE